MFLAAVDYLALRITAYQGYSLVNTVLFFFRYRESFAVQDVLLGNSVVYGALVAKNCNNLRALRGLKMSEIGSYRQKLNLVYLWQDASCSECCHSALELFPNLYSRVYV